LTEYSLLRLPNVGEPSANRSVLWFLAKLLLLRRAWGFLVPSAVTYAWQTARRRARSVRRSRSIR